MEVIYWSSLHSRFYYIKKLLIACLLLISFVVLTSCTSSNSTNVNENLNDLLNSPESLIIKDTIYSLNIYLWRDFMPTIDTLKNGLSISFKLNSENNYEVFTKPCTFYKLGKVWLINDSEIWKPKMQRDTNLSDEYYAHNGPTWGVNKNVSVVAEIFLNDVKYLLKASNIKIEAVY